MTEDNNLIWLHDSLEINERGEVAGAAYTREFEGGYDVVVGISSYEYEIHGETKMNHVPNVVVNDPDGNIVAEPHAHDSHDPHKAIERAKNTAESVYHNPEQYIE